MEDTTRVREEAEIGKRGTWILWKGISLIDKWESGGKIKLNSNGYVCSNVVYVTFQIWDFMPTIDILTNVSLFGFLLEKAMKIPIPAETVF